MVRCPTFLIVFFVGSAAPGVVLLSSFLCRFYDKKLRCCSPSAAVVLYLFLDLAKMGVVSLFYMQRKNKIRCCFTAAYPTKKQYKNNMLCCISVVFPLFFRCFSNEKTKCCVVLLFFCCCFSAAYPTKKQNQRKVLQIVFCRSWWRLSCRYWSVNNGLKKYLYFCRRCSWFAPGSVVKFANFQRVKTLKKM